MTGGRGSPGPTGRGTREHMITGEQLALPLVNAHVTTAEWAAKVQAETSGTAARGYAAAVRLDDVRRAPAPTGSVTAPSRDAPAASLRSAPLSPAHFDAGTRPAATTD